MLIKTGDAEIVGIIDQEEIKDDSKRKSALENALVKAKERISGVKISEEKKDNITEN